VGSDASKGRVALISMPFAPAVRPSIQLGILKALLSEQGIPADDHYLCVDFLAALRDRGWQLLYRSALDSLVAEWLFAAECRRATGDEAAAEDASRPLPQRIAEGADAAGLSHQDMRAIQRELVPAFLATQVNEIDWSRYAVACFTLTYPQICASLAMAARLKEATPAIKTVFGGATSQLHPDAAREYLRAFPCADAVVVGEAEPVFVELVERLRSGRAPGPLDGVFYRRGRGVSRTTTTSVLHRLNESPVPDYRGFFAKCEQLDAQTQELIEGDLPIELSRGCPWGAKQPCAFCGFYPGGGYRPKSQARVLAEVTAQRERSPTSVFGVVDAAVTPAVVQKTLAELPRHCPEAEISFVEVRSSLERSHLETFSRCRTRLLQPGIECLEEGLLQRIAKGVGLEQNLRFLKWCRELSLGVSYNLMLGIPGATEAEWRGQLALLKRIPHLHAPYPIDLLLVRASAYWQRPRDFGLRRLRPHALYREIFPASVDVGKIAYEFEADWDREATRAAEEAVQRQIRRWQQWWIEGEIPSLVLDEVGDGWVIEDGRNPRLPLRRVELDRVGGQIYGAIMDRALDLDQLAALPGLGCSASEVEAILAELDERQLVFRCRGGFLALATRG